MLLKLSVFFYYYLKFEFSIVIIHILGGRGDTTARMAGDDDRSLRELQYLLALWPHASGGLRHLAEACMWREVAHAASTKQRVTPTHSLPRPGLGALQHLT